MTEEEAKDLQRQAEEAQAEFNAMAKRFDETGFFTAEDEEIARTVKKQLPPTIDTGAGK